MNFLVCIALNYFSKKWCFFTIPLGLFMSIQIAIAQVVCVQSVNQDTPVSTGVHNLIKNGSFENTTCATGGYFCPSSVSYSCDLSDWKCTNGGERSYCMVWDSFYSNVVDGYNTVYLGNAFARTCNLLDQDTSCLINVDNVVTGINTGFPINDFEYGLDKGVSLEQEVTGLSIGNYYVLDFWAGGEDLSLFPDKGLFAVDLGFGNVFLRCPSTEPNSLEVGTVYVIIFKATSTTHKIKFTNWGHICQTCSEVILDNVKVYSVSDLSSTFPTCGIVVPIENENLVIPNLFTPNNDNNNDFFEIIYEGNKDYTLEVYNRWGASVFKSNDKNILWNGKVKDEYVSDGVYYYSLFIGSEKHSGWVHVIR